MAGLYSHTTRASGLTLTASIYNADHQNHIDNMDPDQMDDESSDVTAMQATADPGEVGSESLPTSLQGEIQRLRNMLKEITGEAQWYVTPRGDLDAAVGVIRTVTENITVTQADRGTLFVCSTSAANIVMTLATNLVTQGFRVGFKKLTTDNNLVIIEPGVTHSTIDLVTSRDIVTGQAVDWLRADDNIWYVESRTFEGGVSEATITQVQTTSAVGVYVSPEKAQYEIGNAKFFGLISGQDAPVLISGYNLDIITAQGTGKWSIVFKTFFENPHYVNIGQGHTNLSRGVNVRTLSQTASQVLIQQSIVSTAGPEQSDISIIGFGSLLTG